VAEGISRDEIANRLGVTVGSLQVTCSRLGISFRRTILSNGLHHTADVWPAPGSEDTELGVLMELEVGHGETEVYARVQA
jgi:hypothetical protein